MVVWCIVVIINILQCALFLMGICCVFVVDQFFIGPQLLIFIGRGAICFVVDSMV